MSEEKLRKLIDNRVPGLVLILVIFGIIEFGILIVCIAFSANQDIVRIYNAENQMVYENEYNITHIREFKRACGISNFKDAGFTVTRLKQENKFPTRAWIALSICIPLIVVLFTAFIIKVFEDIFHSPRKKDNQEDIKNKENEEAASGEPGGETVSDFEETKFEKLFSTLGRLNIYSLAATVLLIALLLWMVPDLLVYVGKISYETISELKWVILGIILLGGIFGIVKTILAHKTQNEIIRQQAEIQKNRDRLAMEAKLELSLMEKQAGLIENKSKSTTHIG